MLEYNNYSKVSKIKEIYLIEKGCKFKINYYNKKKEKLGLLHSYYCGINFTNREAQVKHEFFFYTSAEHTVRKENV